MEVEGRSRECRELGQGITSKDGPDCRPRVGAVPPDHWRAIACNREGVSARSLSWRFGLHWGRADTLRGVCGAGGMRRGPPLQVIWERRAAESCRWCGIDQVSWKVGSTSTGKVTELAMKHFSWAV